MARALARRLLGGDIEAQRRLALGGLVHDVGELYIDPTYLRRDTPLQAEQWKHIVTHPLVGQRVLHRMDGAGPALAELVLSHHERLDGFGYPRGLAGEQFGIEAQVLAAAEWLMGLLESGSSLVAHASVATRLMPGGFGPELLETLRAAGRASDASGHLADEHRSLEAALPQALRVSELQQSFSSVGLDMHGPEHVFRLLARSHPEVQQEVLALAREFAWRLRELEGAPLMRAALMCPEDLALVQTLIEAVRGAALQPAETSGPGSRPAGACAAGAKLAQLQRGLAGIGHIARAIKPQQQPLAAPQLAVVTAPAGKFETLTVQCAGMDAA